MNRRSIFLSRCVLFALMCLCIPLLAQAEATAPGVQLVETTPSPLDPPGEPGWVMVIQGQDGILNAPIPETARQEMLADFEQDRSTATDFGSETHYFVNPRALEALERARSGGSLHPYLRRMADPERGCGDEVKEVTRNFDLDWDGFSLEEPLGAFSGSLSVSADVEGDATLIFRYEIKRVLCIPYWVKFRNIRIYGDASIGGQIGLEGSLSNTSNPWQWEEEIAKPHLGSVNFTVGPIPVHIGFNLPITAGAQAGLSVNAAVGLEASGDTTGSFDYTCTFGGCSGSSSFNLAGLSAPLQPTASIEGRADLRGWVEIAARAYLYSEVVAYAQVGVKPVLYGDLWGYFGNGCGDIDCDGVPELVQALTANLDWQLFVTAKADTFLAGPWDWTLWNTQRSHIAFFDILGSSSAIEPILRGPSVVAPGASGVFTARMRSCWPYEDSFMNYSVAWPDGSTSTFSNPAEEAQEFEGVLDGFGNHDVTLTAVSDSHGRDLGHSTTLSVNVSPFLPGNSGSCGSDSTGGDGDGDNGGNGDPLSSGLVCEQNMGGGSNTLDCVAVVEGGVAPHIYYWRAGADGAWFIAGGEWSFNCDDVEHGYFKAQDANGTWTIQLTRSCSDLPR